MNPAAHTLWSVTRRDDVPYRHPMNGVEPSPDLVGLTIVVYATLAGLLAWLVHMIRRAPHPGIHLRERLQKTVRRR